MTINPVIISCKKFSANKAYVFFEYDAENLIFPGMVRRDTSVLILKSIKGGGMWLMK